MKSSLIRLATITTVSLGLLTAALHAQDASPVPQVLAEALKLKGGKTVVLQPVQMRRGQSLLVSYTKFADGSVRKGFEKFVALAIYSTDGNDNGNLLYSQLKPIGGGGAGGAPYVKVFDEFTPDADQKGIIAVLIGLLLPAVQAGDGSVIPLPFTDAISAEIHDETTGLRLLLPAVPKIRETASR